ncbi:MAG: DNA methyltransferase [Spirochaetia bacterium]|jgi:site-specific DNA-methyltransferase (adenine-specific)
MFNSIMGNKKHVLSKKRRPGEIRDSILSVLVAKPEGATPSEIEHAVKAIMGDVKSSSIRSYLRLNSPELFSRSRRGFYLLRDSTATATAYEAPHVKTDRAGSSAKESFSLGRSTLIHADCFDWLAEQPPNSYQAIVTDPPYGLVEYTQEQQEKLRNGRGGVWRIPPSFDGVARAPLPRFTVLSDQDLVRLEQFFYNWARLILAVIVPGANVVVASNPLLSYIVSGALSRAGLERRGEIVRLVMTMRGGDRPKAAHEEFPDVSVMPRSMWEPWIVFRKPIEGRVQDNLRKWKTGGFRRPSKERPFGDVIPSAPTNKSERRLAPHPSLKPQEFLRTLVRGVLPMGEGVVLDTFAGSGSTLAAAESVGYTSVGVENDPHFFDIAQKAIPKLREYKNGGNYSFSL